MKTLIGILFSLFLSISAFSQFEMIAVKSGTMHIGAFYNDSMVHVVSKDARVIMNFETSEIRINISPTAFSLGIDSLDKFITQNLHDPITFIGKMGIDFYSPEQNRVEKFDIEGDLMINGVNKYVLMEGVLTSDLPSGANTQGKVEIHYDLLFEDYKLPDIFEPFKGSACIQITQAILKKKKH